jgi:hypothetical protein
MLIIICAGRIIDNFCQCTDLEAFVVILRYRMVQLLILLNDVAVLLIPTYRNYGINDIHTMTLSLI